MPDHNDDQIEKLAEFISGLRHVTKIRVLPYHNYAGSKYAALDMENTLPERVPSEWDVENAKNILKKITGLDVLS